MFQKGDLFDGYRVLRQVGSGTYGTVYEAENEATGQHCALKVLPLCSRGTERELRALVRSRGIVSAALIPIYHIRADGDRLCYTMAWADGGTLADRKMTPAEILTMARRLLTALAELHHAGVLHRDIKPENILLIHDAPVLGDVSLLCDDSPNATQIGTPGFLPPEVVLGQEKISARCDVYALGMSLYTILSGKPPAAFPDYDGASDPAAALLLKAILTVCSPGSRIRSAEAFARLLEPSAPAPARNKTLRLTAVALAALLLTAGGAVFLKFYRVKRPVPAVKRPLIPFSVQEGEKQIWLLVRKHPEFYSGTVKKVEYLRDSDDRRVYSVEFSEKNGFTLYCSVILGHDAKGFFLWQDTIPYELVKAGREIKTPQKLR